ncbi:RNase adapter RapZ [Kineococcus rubinsiae]|uniref:RNase adapter RapZ n=1 Tax=Kineococcus rubinsiae TaxID=2609562 RepID=UPI00358DC75C
MEPVAQRPGDPRGNPSGAAAGEPPASAATAEDAEQLLAGGDAEQLLTGGDAEPAPAADAGDPGAGGRVRRPELLIITGMSGAGRSTTGKALEDLGWYVVDNLPPQMLEPLAELAGRAGLSVPRIAVVVDVRGRTFFAELTGALNSLDTRHVSPRVLFLDATDEVLVRRFESVRRPHPLQGDDRIVDGIARERALTGDLRSRADVVVDSSAFNVHQLGALVASLFEAERAEDLRVTVMSFGFKYGTPADAEHIADVRFIPNPHWEPDLRPLTGKDEPVADFVLAAEGARPFLDRYTDALDPVFAGYRRENKRYATVAFGCTGGKHRSVAMAEELGKRLTRAGVPVRVLHRDLGRE